jgi:hypothetical protein
LDGQIPQTLAVRVRQQPCRDASNGRNNRIHQLSEIVTCYTVAIIGSNYSTL